jgi:hypothetical protein
MNLKEIFTFENLDKSFDKGVRSFQQGYARLWGFNEQND